MRTQLPVVLIALALAACSRDKPAANDTASAPAATAANTPAARVPIPPKPENPDAAFDKAAFAGTFSAGQAKLILEGDGTYQLELGTNGTRGTWTYEGGSIRIDPESKGAEDRVFRIVNDAQLMEAGSQTPLRREAAR